MPPVRSYISSSNILNLLRYLELAGPQNRALQSRGQTTCHPHYSTRNKQSMNYENSFGNGALPSVHSSIAPQQGGFGYSTSWRRTYSTSYREGLEKDQEKPASLDISTDPASTLDAAPSTAPAGNEILGNVAVESSFKSSPRHDLAMIFTCTVCNVRSAKTMSRATYETGVVIVRCPGCQNLHLIADRYGWFGEAGSVEDFLAEKGIDVRKGSDASYEFTVEDMSGWTPKGKPEN